LIVLITDYSWRPWTCRIAAPCKSRVVALIDSLIDAKAKIPTCATFRGHLSNSWALACFCSFT